MSEAKVAFVGAGLGGRFWTLKSYTSSSTTKWWQQKINQNGKLQSRKNAQTWEKRPAASMELGSLLEDSNSRTEYIVTRARLPLQWWMTSQFESSSPYRLWQCGSTTRSTTLVHFYMENSTKEKTCLWEFRRVLRSTIRRIQYCSLNDVIRIKTKHTAVMERNH